MSQQDNMIVLPTQFNNAQGDSITERVAEVFGEDAEYFLVVRNEERSALLGNGTEQATIELLNLAVDVVNMEPGPFGVPEDEVENEADEEPVRTDKFDTEAPIDVTPPEQIQYGISDDGLEFILPAEVWAAKESDILALAVAAEALGIAVHTHSITGDVRFRMPEEASAIAPETVREMQADFARSWPQYAKKN